MTTTDVYDSNEYIDWLENSISNEYLNYQKEKERKKYTKQKLNPKYPIIA